jgi:TonB family protein
MTRAGTQDCRQYLESGASDMQSQKEAKQKGMVSQFAIAGHDFYRADFEYRQGPDHRTFLCTSTKDYFLQWNIIGWSKQAIEVAVATLNSLTPAPPTIPEETQAIQAAELKGPKRVRVSTGVTVGLLIKKVQPVYPLEARHDGIQGTVIMQATINKSGDVVDLEVLSGPIELVVSAVNAVRKWKYRPYLLKGEPVTVETQIVVNYTLSPF